MLLNSSSSSVKSASSLEKIAAYHDASPTAELSRRNTLSTLHNRNFKIVKNPQSLAQATRHHPVPKRSHSVKNSGRLSEISVNQSRFTHDTPQSNVESTDNIRCQNNLPKEPQPDKSVIEAWFEKHLDQLGSLNSNQLKELATFEKKYPEALQNKLANHIADAYQSEQSTITETQIKVLGQFKMLCKHLPLQLMEAVDKSIINLLKLNKNHRAVEHYQGMQLLLKHFYGFPKEDIHHHHASPLEQDDRVAPGTAALLKEKAVVHAPFQETTASKPCFEKAANHAQQLAIPSIHDNEKINNFLKENKNFDLLSFTLSTSPPEQQIVMESEILKNSLIDLLVKEYQSNNLEVADNKLKFISKIFSPKIMADIAKSVIYKLKESKNPAAIERYQAIMAGEQPVYKGKKELTHYPLLDKNSIHEMEALVKKEYKNHLLLNFSPIKNYAAREKKQLATIKKQIINDLVKAYQSDNYQSQDNKFNYLRLYYAPQWIAEINRSVLNTLKANDNHAAVERYQANLEQRHAVKNFSNSDAELPRTKKAVQAPLQGASAIDSWFENYLDKLSSLASTPLKALTTFEKNYPEALQKKIVNHLVDAYLSENATAADTQRKALRQHLSPPFMAAVDQSVIDTLQAGGNQAAAGLYHTQQVVIQPTHYNDLLKLDQLAKALQAGRSLDRNRQEKLLTDTQERLETIDTNAFTAEQQALLQVAKERVGALEHALPLVDKSIVTHSDILKTIAASGALALCLTALGALIAVLVKLNQSASIEEQAPVDEADSDQTEAIEAKNNEIEAKQNSLQALKDKEQALLEKGANLPEEVIKRAAELAGFEEVIKENKLAYNKIEFDVRDPKPTEAGHEIIEKFVNEALTEHRENQNTLSDVRNELQAAQNDLKAQQEALEALKLQQGKSEIKKESPLTTRSLPNNNTTIETGILASIGLGVAASAAGAAGLFAVNSSKVFPQFKLRRANTQAVQSLNKIVKTNQPHFSDSNNNDLMNA